MSVAVDSSCLWYPSIRCSGLKTQFGLINDGQTVGYTILIIVVAWLSKVRGVTWRKDAATTCNDLIVATAQCHNHVKSSLIGDWCHDTCCCVQNSDATLYDHGSVDDMQGVRDNQCAIRAQVLLAFATCA